jgi:hypothetical protein
MGHWRAVGSALIVGLGLALAPAGCGGMVADGPQTIGRVAATRDAHGCTTIDTGADTDGDGELADAEVALSTQVCKPPPSPDDLRCPGGTSHTGDVIIHETADWAQLTDIACIDGDLLIVGTEEPELQDLQTLTTVTGNVVIAANPGFTTLAALANVHAIGGGLLVQANDGLADLVGAGAIPGLRELAVVGNAHLPDVTGLEAFDCTTALVIAENPELASLHGLEDHACIGSLLLCDNASLTTLEPLAALTTAGALVLDGNGRLATPDLPALATVRGELRIANEPFARLELPALAGAGALEVEANSLLQSVTLPLANAGTIDVSSNPHLALLDLPQLTSAGAITVRSNPALAGIRANLGSLGSLELVGNTALAAVQLGALTETSGDFDVEHTAGSIDALGSLSKIGGSLTLHGAVPLPAARAFAKRVDVAGAISIE